VIKKCEPTLSTATKLSRRAYRLGVDVSDPSVVRALSKVLTGTHFLAVVEKGLHKKAFVVEGRFQRP